MNRYLNYVRRIVIACCIGLLSGSMVANSGDRTNVILIAADDLGYGELGCYGQAKIQTPRIDQLAAEGMRFTDFYSGNAVCAPSRCCLMTGKHPGHAFIRDNLPHKVNSEGKQAVGTVYDGQWPIPSDEITLAERVKGVGYATGAFGKWGLGHFGTSGDPNDQGFDLFYGFNCQYHAHNHYPKFLWRNRVKEDQPGNDRTLYGQTYSQDQFVTEAIRFIRENRDRPFFAYLPFAVPHLSIQVPNEDLAAYDGVIEEQAYEHRGYLPHPRPRAAYAAMVSHMDAGVGQIVDVIEELGLTENTLIMFTSDNGPTYDRLGGSDSEYFNSAGGLKGLKGQLDEGGIRVPLIARQPGVIAAGQTTDWMGAWWDLHATVSDACGVKIESSAIDGISFLPLLRGDQSNQAEHPFLYWEFGGYTGQQAVRMGQWKAIRKNLMAAGKTKQPPAWALYDLKNDPSESHDVAPQNPAVIDRIVSIATAEHSPSELFAMPMLDSQR
ncbi:arylsulfatase [Neorhodopirellula pilleata]|uniref:Arylsulfatase n=1 Tax=Neorhodopirellula pilleata TaxID=2714738 RepID=A0A5C6ARQ5_9BACT|nr:arylsulfatase [Neorhodopirellula pilleata]TWU01939.1 Arylsulfatase [Neorhodopirellula pilleata]